MGAAFGADRIRIDLQNLNELARTASNCPTHQIPPAIRVLLYHQPLRREPARVSSVRFSREYDHKRRGPTGSNRVL